MCKSNVGIADTVIEVMSALPTTVRAWSIMCMRHFSMFVSVFAQVLLGNF